MDTNDLLHRWSTQSLDEIEDEIRRGEDQDTIVQLLGAETVAEMRGISFAPPVPGPQEEVILLPGIMGSLLSSIRGVTSLLWINPLLFLEGNARYLRVGQDGLTDECADVEVMPLSLEKLTYLKISLTLNGQVRLHEFPYDWRKPIETSADILHASIERWSEGDPTRQFSLVAHSMGGLVSRAYMARYPKSAQQRVKRLILHGTPNFGATSAIDNLLNGNDMMATADRLNSQNNMRQLAYCLPSVYQLLPAPQDCFPTGRPYPAGFELYNAAAWGLASIQQKYLDGARSFYQMLAASDPQVPVSEIAGCHYPTMVSAGLQISAGQPILQPQMVAEGDNSGDGTVPLWSSRLPSADVYYIQEVHRNLPSNGDVIRATLDLIHKGTCDLPQTLPPRRLVILGVTTPITFDAQAEDLREKIETGTAGKEDLAKLYFAL